MGTIFIQGDRVIDLSQAKQPGIPVPSRFPGPEFETFASQAGSDVGQAERVRCSLHITTHCDAPHPFVSEFRHTDLETLGQMHCHLTALPLKLKGYLGSPSHVITVD